MAFPLVQDEVQGDYGNTPNSTWDSINASGEMAANFTGPLNQVADVFNMAGLENKYPNQRTMMVPELNQKYPGVQWTEPQKEKVAEYIAQAHADKERLANRINLSDKSLIGDIGRFAVGNLTSMGDPLMMAGGAGIGTAFRATGMLAEGGLATAMARGAAEGATVMTPLEVANIAHERAMENDVSINDSIGNVAFGSLLGAGIEGALHGFGSTSKPHEPEPKILGSGSKPEHNAQLIDVAARQMAEGLRPNIEPLKDLYENQRQGVGPKPVTDFSGRSNYQHIPTDTSKPVSGTFFHGNVSKNENFHALDFNGNVNSAESFGSGVYVNDNAMKANGYAEGGLVHSVETNGAKLLPLDDKLGDSEPVVTKFLKSQNMPKFADDYANGKINAREAYANLTEQAKGELNTNLKEAGYDGLHFEDNSKDGSTPSNGVMLFDKAKAEPKAAYEYDPSHVAGLTEEGKKELAGAHDNPDNQIGHDAKEEAAIDEFKKQSEEHYKMAGDTQQIDDGLSHIDSQIKALKENGVLKPGHEEEIAEIEKAGGKQDGRKVLQAMADCLVGH